MKRYFLILLALITVNSLSAQEIKLPAIASPEQVYGETVGSETLLPMNDLDIEYGYALYQAEITMVTEDAILEVENVRDYAAVYASGVLQGTLMDNRKKLTLTAIPGTYTLQLYVENIGRKTYGPEILDNSKGLFGEITLDGEPIENWQITELKVKDCSVNTLDFSNHAGSISPGFRKGTFSLDAPRDTYLDISGWGMGEVWINGSYMGSFWEEEKQQSIQIPASVLAVGDNELVVFELKSNGKESMRLSDTAVFK